jgi:hypothetical protein
VRWWRALFGPLAGDVRDATPTHDPGDFALLFGFTIFLHYTSRLWTVHFYDLDGDSLASGQATVAPAIIYFVFDAFPFPFPLIDVVPKRP